MQNAKLVGTRPGQVALSAAAALLLVAAALLIFLQPSLEAQGNDKATSNLAVSSPNPGELAITWDAPTDAPDDYRVTWKKSDGKWHSYKRANTVDGGNAYPHRHVPHGDRPEGGNRIPGAGARPLLHDDNGNLEQSGPWSDAVEITISATPSQDGEGDSNEGQSSSPPAKPDGLITAASHDSVLLSWDNPDDDTITGYQVLRGEDADNRWTVLTDGTGSATNQLHRRRPLRPRRHMSMPSGAATPTGSARSPIAVSVNDPGGSAGQTHRPDHRCQPRQRPADLGQPRRRHHHRLPGTARRRRRQPSRIDRRHRQHERQLHRLAPLRRRRRTPMPSGARNDRWARPAVGPGDVDHVGGARGG